MVPQREGIPNLQTGDFVGSLSDASLFSNLFNNFCFIITVQVSLVHLSASGSALDIPQDCIMDRVSTPNIAPHTALYNAMLQSEKHCPRVEMFLSRDYITLHRGAYMHRCT